MPTSPNHRSEDMRGWFVQAVSRGASDVHLVAGYPPMARVHGELVPLTDAALDSATLTTLLTDLCPPAIREQVQRSHNADFAFELEHQNRRYRFRADVFISQRQIGACFRLIPADIPTCDWAGFPQSLAERLIGLKNGLVLVTGVAGSGKTTTLAMLVNLLNQQEGFRIITVEDPVEYVFTPTSRSMVTQREVGTDVLSFADGLKYGLRQDPDVLLVGEIRDPETAQMALSAAETGHLVLSTMHTRDAKGAITRFVDLFPQDSQTDIRTQLALSLRAVISQHLLPSAAPGAKRALALEVMFNTLPIASAIRSGKIENIDNSILTGRSEGMITFDESLRRLLYDGQISLETARQFASDPNAFSLR